MELEGIYSALYAIVTFLSEHQQLFSVSLALLSRFFFFFFIIIIITILYIFIIHRFIILNWKALEPLGPFRYKILCMIICIIMMNFLTGIADENIDNWGHLGGLLTGIALSFAILKPLKIVSYTKKL